MNKSKVKSIVEKSKAERALFKAEKKKYNESKRGIDPTYTKRSAGFGLKSNDITQLSYMLKVADALEIERMSE